MDEKTKEARELYEKIGMLGTAALIDVLQFQKDAGMNVTKLGGTIDLHGLTGKPFDDTDPEASANAFMAYMSLPHFDLGGGGRTALEHLTSLADSAAETPEESRKIFDRICSDFVAIERAPHRKVISFNDGPGENGIPTYGPWENLKN